jgi:glycosyltransferase involved in cell wall biosynthesis
VYRLDTIPFQHRDSRDAYDDIIKNFQTIRARVAFVSEGFDTARGDVVIATGWQTVAQALNATNFRQRFYFVQDYEVNFHPMGSSALIAYWTYTQELACICASPWLANMLTQRFGRWTRHFFLAYDRDIYFPLETSKRRSKLEQRPGSRIVLYARVSTARRAVELALLALEQLAKSGVKFHVDLFGEMNTWSSAPFPCRSHGILNAGDLAELYRDADIGICFSTTNYSIVPQEMMACGLPVVEIDGDSTRTTFPEDVVTFTGPHPLRIAADINALLKDQPRRDTQANAALLWTSQFDWEKSAKAVESALLERLLSEPASPSADAPKPIVARRPIKATVCIPVFNGGKSLLRLIKHLRSQRTPWLFEIVIVDSGSTDGSMQKLGASAGTPLSLRIATIPQHEFQHGRTRNLCANMAKGEFVAFLTQDALPTDDFWLYNLVTTLEHFPHAAGAFGRHIAMPTASPFMKHELITHFARLTQQPLALSRDTDIDRWNSGDQEWRQILHFFSDNNSCLRRSVWQRVPYPELDYGEDQVWADNIIRLGYEKVFAPSATVYHSHDHTPDETRARAAIEAFFFADAFGYQSYDDLRDFDEQLAAMQHSDMRWARGNGVSQAALTRQLTLNEAKLLGRRDGVRRALKAA